VKANDISDMTRANAIGLSTAVLFVALWAFPLARAVSFFGWAQDYLRADHTLNASNDFSYSLWLLVCYGISLFAALVFAWLLSRKPRLLLLIPGAALAVGVGEVFCLRPEEPIHLFPAINPLRPALFSVMALAVTFFIVCICPRLLPMRESVRREP
jgi:hypothetical protein